MAAKTEKEKDKKGKKNAKEGSGQPSRLSRILADERLPKVSGLTLIFAAVVLLVAFSSYLFTWKIDNSEVHEFSWEFIFSGDVSAANKLGRLGALLAHQFFYYGFGICSFLFVPLLFLTGVKLINRSAPFSLKKFAKYAFLSLIWFSTAIAFVAGPGRWSGAFGNAVNDWLSGFMGAFGTGALLVFSMLTFLVVTFNMSLNPPLLQWRNKLRGKGPEAATAAIDTEVKEWEREITAENQSTEEPAEEAPLDEPQIEEEPEVAIEEEPEADNVLDMELTTPQPVADVPVHDEVQLDIEEAKKEEILEDAENINYDPTLDLSNYKYPPIDLLEEYGTEDIKIDPQELEKNKNQIIETLKHYNIEISKIKATIGPTVTLYEIVPAAGVRISKIKNLEDDIALSLAALGIRIIAPIPGKGTIGIEVPNAKKEIVSMRTLLASEKFQHAKMDLPVALGKNISNEIFVTDLAKMPHLLMAGATGQGKSVGLNAILVSLLYKKHPSQLKFVLVDPKKVELSLFTQIEKHFLAKLPGEEEAIITDTKKVINTLNALCMEMDQRYDLLKDAQVRNIKEYNAKFVARRLNPNKGHKFLPYIVLVVDEFADLMMTAGKEVETPIARLAQLARAIGIHLVIATQRPSVNIITGVIKANFPARIAFKVTSKVDSRTILDAGGADQLIGRGDMLLSQGSDMVRLQCGFLDTPEVEKVTEFIGAQQGYPEAMLLPEVASDEDGIMGDFDSADKDELFDEAAHIIVSQQQGSTSLLQRRLKLGYNRAGRLMDQLEAAGIVGPSEGSKAREVLISDLTHLEQFLKGGVE